MTVSYQYDVASSTSGGFTRLLFKWKGSVYKLIHFELVVFLIGYYSVTILYWTGLDSEQKRKFEQVAFYCDTYMNYIPLSFILGFYVSFVASRWWQQYSAIPWPDRILHGIALYVSGNDDNGRMMRRTMVRYLNLSLVLVLRSISSAVKQRFPTIDHLIESGFMTSAELKIFRSTPSKEFNTYWIPFTWFTNLIREARVQKMLVDNPGTKLVMQEFYNFRDKCGMLWSYDWVSIPLVYTQVVTIATYSFFMAACIARQFVEQSPIKYRNMVNLYIPMFTLMQFFFYMGLLKVAEQLIDPFGDDDEDFELNWIIDRHTKVSYLIVDTLILKYPPLTKDIFFDAEAPELPYTEAAAGFKKKTYRGSAADMIVPEHKQAMVLPNIMEEESEEEDILPQVPLKTPVFLNINELNQVDSGPGDNIDQFRSTSSKPNLKASKLSSDSYKGSFVADSSAEKERPLFYTNSDCSLDEDGTRRLSSELSYVNLPLRDVYFNVEDGLNNVDIEIRKTTKSKSWMPTSLQGKMAMKKKPVVKWRPYKRPGGDIPVDFEQLAPSELPPGEFEEECAFMWRTIVEETDSIGRSSNKTSQSDLLTGAIIDKLTENKNSSNKLSSLDSRLKFKELRKSLHKNHDTKVQRLKRPSHKIKGRTRRDGPKNIYKSLPTLTDQHREQVAFNYRFRKSLSLSSYFFNAISYRVQQQGRHNHLPKEKLIPKDLF